MGKKLIFSIFLLVFLFSTVSAFTDVTTKINQPYNITTTCDTVPCNDLNITVFYPNSSIFVDNGAMTQDTYYAVYEVTPPVNGVYYYVVADFTGAAEIDTEGSLTVTSTGVELTTSKSITYAAMFFLLIFFFGITIFGIDMLPSRNERDEEGKILSISYLKYLRNVLWLFEWMLLLGIMFMAANLGFAYLGEELFADVFFTIFRIMLGLTPVIIIVWIIWIYRQMFHDKQMQSLLKRGFFPQGNI